MNGTTIPSILCGTKLDIVCTAMANYAGPPLGQNGTPLVRDYVEPLLPIVLTLTNLRGVPYLSDFRGASGRAEYYSDYADFIRFKADVTGRRPPAAADLQPYEVGIANALTPGVLTWSTAIHAARGSSAFPVGLPPQVITRDVQHYRYRYTTISGATPADPMQAVWMRPAWPYMIPVGASAATPYAFLCVDGGVFNNEPTEYARQWLSGVVAHNPRDGATAHRAVLLVDPFADVPDYGLTKDEGILKSAGATLGAFSHGTRYETADLDLFTADDVFSRFLVNPVRVNDKNQTVTGGDAIATDSIDAFGGFLHPAFREHDFLLGRRNCQRFLQTQFVLPVANTLFDKWTAQQRAAFAHPDAPGFLPIIPLMKPLDTAIPQPRWPKGALTPDALSNIKSLIGTRLSKLAALELTSLDLSWPWSWLTSVAASNVGSTGADKAADAITAALKAADLA